MPVSLGTTTITALYLGTTSISSAYLGNTQVFGGSFTPLSLFSSGSQGIWLDPSDLSTMFSDRAGTTPVTAPGTVVGLRLDKSKGLTLGAELVTNGGPDFASSTGWSLLNDTTVNVVSGDFEIVRGAGTGQIAQSFATVVGKTYKISATVRRGTAASFTVSVGNGETGSSIYTSGTRTDTAYTDIVAYFSAASTTTWVRIGIGGTVVGSTVFADNISVRELAGNHAVAPTDAARAVYGIEPKGGRRNLLTWSEDFGNAVWTKQNGSITSTSETAPDGTATADKFTPAATLSPEHRVIISTVIATAGGFTLSLWVKPAGYSKFGFRNSAIGTYAAFDLSGVGSVITASGLTASIAPAANGFYRVEIKDTSANIRVDFWPLDNSYTSGSPSVYSYTGDGTSGILIWGAQLELGSTATAYQRVTTAYDITESGVATCHYVQYDGSDDSMSTAAIDFTATDKMSVFAGVRKLSDAAAGFLMELSADLGANSGSFGAWAPFSTTVEYAVQSRGTASSTSAQRLAIDNAAFVAPVSNVLTGLFDISGDTASARLNGASQGAATADQGTGNFGNYPLFIGRRNNATLPFNGRDFGIIVVGKLASAGEITDTETWLAAKTSGVSI